MKLTCKPLLNARGEVIGINTQKLIKKNVTGIGFALSASNLLEVLRRFYPNSGPLIERTSSATPNRPSPCESMDSPAGSNANLSAAPEPLVPFPSPPIRRARKSSLTTSSTATLPPR
jgi:S1-C subfamily serine protease